MPESKTECSVTFHPVQEYDDSAIDLLLYVITSGKHFDELVQDILRNENGQYDELYEDSKQVQ